MRAWADGDLMKTKDFQAFVEQLGDLSESQRQVVVAALKGKGSANDAIRLIERQFDADPAVLKGGLDGRYRNDARNGNPRQ